MANVTVEDVANQALAYLTEAPITSLDEDVKSARLLNAHWDTTIQEELELHRWSFSIREVDLSGGTDLGTVSGSLNYQFDLPEDFLAIMPVGYNEEYEAIPINWRYEGDYLYTDQSTTQHLRYVAYVDDPADWPAWFVTLIACALAVKIAHAMTGKQSLTQGAQAAYDRALARAHRADVRNKGRLNTELWGIQRGDYRYWRP